MSRKEAAAIIIGSFASLAAAWSASTAAVPVVGPLLGDTTGLTILTVAMAGSLCALYRRDANTASLMSFGSFAFGFIAGNLALKIGASFIPIFGSWFNATTTFVLHAATGWALVEVLEAGKSIDDLSASEWDNLFKKNKGKAKDEKKKYEAALSKLPRDAQEQVKNLRKKLSDKGLSDSERDVIVKKIADIFEHWGVVYTV